MTISSYRTVHDLLKSLTKNEWEEIESSFITTKKIMQTDFTMNSQEISASNDEFSEVHQLFKRIKQSVKRPSKSQESNGYLVAKITSEKKEYKNTLINLHEQLLYNPDHGDIRETIDFITETGILGQAEFPSINEQIIAIQEQLETAKTDVYATFALLNDTDHDDMDIYETLTFTSIDDILPYTLSMNYNETKDISRVMFITNLFVELYEISFYEDEKQLILEAMATAADYFDEIQQQALTNRPIKNIEFNFQTSLDKFLNELPVLDDGIDH